MNNHAAIQEALSGIPLTAMSIDALIDVMDNPIRCFDGSTVDASTRATVRRVLFARGRKARSVLAGRGRDFRPHGVRAQDAARAEYCGAPLLAINVENDHLPYD